MTKIKKTTKRVRLQIKQEHIDKGIKLECSSCPVALALNSIIKTDSYAIGIGVTLYSIWRKSNVTQYKDILIANKRLSNFIRRFDGGLKVKPSTFYIDVPIECLK